MYTACILFVSLGNTPSETMARLKGKLEILGTLDELSLYKTQDGIIVRRKWGPDKTECATIPPLKV